MMVILKDLLNILHDVTKLEVWAYADYKLQHQWIFGEDIEETIHQYRDRERGVLSIIDQKINVHNEPKKNGTGEVGWCVKLEAIPKEILNTKCGTYFYPDGLKEGICLCTSTWMRWLWKLLNQNWLEKKER